MNLSLLGSIDNLNRGSDIQIPKWWTGNSAANKIPRMHWKKVVNLTKPVTIFTPCTLTDCDVHSYSIRKCLGAQAIMHASDSAMMQTLDEAVIHSLQLFRLIPQAYYVEQLICGFYTEWKLVILCFYFWHLKYVESVKKTFFLIFFFTFFLNFTYHTHTTFIKKTHKS